MKKLRILAFVHDHLVPPTDTTDIDILEAEWKMEYDVIETLKEIGHDVRVLGMHDDLIGYARIDIRMNEEGDIFVLEANPNPNLAYGEDFAESGEVSGVSYERLLERILTLGLRWEPERTG